MSIHDNPIDELEQQRSVTEMGMLGYHLYRGAREAGATRMEACRVLGAWFFSLTLGTPPDES